MKDHAGLDIAGLKEHGFKAWITGKTPAQQHQKATSKEKIQQAKAEYQQAEADRKAGKGLAGKLSKWGLHLTILLTVPMLLTALLGPLGTVIAVVIVIAYFASRKNTGNEADAESTDPTNTE